MSEQATPTPDPDDPEMRAIGADGELLGGVFWLPDDIDPEAVTAADLDRATHIGYAKPPKLGRPE